MINVIFLILVIILIFSSLDDKYTEYLGSPLLWTLEIIWIIIWFIWFILLDHNIIISFN